MRIVIDTSAIEDIILADQFIDPEQAIRGNVAGMILNAKANTIDRYSQSLRDDPDVTQMSADDDSLLTQMVADPNYLSAVDKVVLVG